MTDASLDRHAAPEAASFARVLTWRDGFTISLVIPVAIFATIGPSIATVGSGALAVMFAIAGTFAIIQNFLFAEMAAMFPDKAGGISLYAHEAFKRYFAPLGCVIVFGYWAGWAFGNAVFALTLGQLVQAQWFEGATWTISTGAADIGLPHLLAIAALASTWVLNAYGVKPTVRMNKFLGLVAIGLMVVLGVLPFFTGDFNADAVTSAIGGEGPWGGYRLALVFFFILGWTTYATEGVATFTPEFHNPRKDMPKALITACFFTLAAAVLMALGMGGTVGDAKIAQDPGGIYAIAFEKIIGPASGLVTLLVVACLYLVLNAGTATAGRALYGLAKDDMTIRQLNHLNHRQVPARAMFCDLVLNIVMLLFVGNVLGIIFAANVGYMLAIVLALVGYVLLRKDRPNWPRPIRLPAFMTPVAILLALINASFVVVGFTFPGDGGYGGLEEQLIGLGILATSLVLFLYRRIVQDRGPLRLREREPEPEQGHQTPTPDLAMD